MITFIDIAEVMQVTGHACMICLALLNIMRIMTAPLALPLDAKQADTLTDPGQTARRPNLSNLGLLTVQCFCSTPLSTACSAQIG